MDIFEGKLCMCSCCPNTNARIPIAEIIRCIYTFHLQIVRSSGTRIWMVSYVWYMKVQKHRTATQALVGLDRISRTVWAAKAPIQDIMLLYFISLHYQPNVFTWIPRVAVSMKGHIAYTEPQHPWIIRSTFDASHQWGESRVIYLSVELDGKPIFVSSQIFFISLILSIEQLTNIRIQLKVEL